MNNVFKALNDPTRRQILEFLRERDMTAGEIVEKFRISGPSISHHLDLLKQAQLVIAEKEDQREGDELVFAAITVYRAIQTCMQRYCFRNRIPNHC